MSIADLRQNYAKSELLEDQVNPNPFEQFNLWFDQALSHKDIIEPNAMTVSTVNAKGQPSSRILLLKGVDQEGFTFFTNYTSSKGQDLAQNPYCSLLFFWLPLERQIHINGRVVKVDDASSESYFKSRPVGSQIGAWVSHQSQITTREALAQRQETIQARFGDNVPRPEFWGGYKLIPESIEFWQGRPSRLHDRIKFTQNAETKQWSFVRLCP